MKKLIALIACISVFACMSVSALAATPAASTDKISYTEATDTASGYFTINASEVATGNTQTTIVVIDGVKTVEDGVEKYNISTDTIQYINQQDNASFTVIPKDHDTYLEGATEKTLTVLIGGDNITRKELGTITYAAAGGEDQKPTSYMVGDVDGDLSVTIGDVTTLIDKVLEKITYFTDAEGKALPLLVGDVDNDTSITIGDVTTEIDRVLEKITSFEKETYELPAGVTPESTYSVQ